MADNCWNTTTTTKTNKLLLYKIRMQCLGWVKSICNA